MRIEELRLMNLILRHLTKHPECSMAEEINEYLSKPVSEGRYGKEECPYSKGNALCTNGKDTYHEWNVNIAGSCPFCGKTKEKVRGAILGSKGGNGVDSPVYLPQNFTKGAKEAPELPVEIDPGADCTWREETVEYKINQIIRYLHSVDKIIKK